MEYTVQRGDTLYTIAQRFSISLLRLYNANKEVLEASGYTCEDFPKVLVIPEGEYEKMILLYDWSSCGKDG